VRKDLREISNLLHCWYFTSYEESKKIKEGLAKREKDKWLVNA
jgi:hypothetical protein